MRTNICTHEDASEKDPEFWSLRRSQLRNWLHSSSPRRPLLPAFVRKGDLRGGTLRVTGPTPAIFMRGRGGVFHNLITSRYQLLEVWHLQSLRGLLSAA